jgi:hypothetical protein
MRRDRFFVMSVADAEGGTHEYLLKARSQRHAERQAHDWVSQTPWCTTPAAVRPVGDQGIARRLLVVGGVTLAVSAPTIAAAVVIGLSLEGAF